MNRITKLVEELLLLTKDKVNIQALEFEEVNINEEIRSRIKSLKQLHPDYQFKTHLSKKPLTLQINRHQFEQLLLIFIDNAMKYDKDNKQIEIATQLETNKLVLKLQTMVLVFLKKIRSSFLTVFIELINPAQEVRVVMAWVFLFFEKIVQQYGGYITVDSEVNQYTTFKIIFK